MLLPGICVLVLAGCGGGGGGGGRAVSANAAPVAEFVSLTTVENEPVDGMLEGSDPDGEDITYLIATKPEHGRVKLLDKESGEFVYTPEVGATGEDAFTYRSFDGRRQSVPATVSVDVSPRDGKLSFVILLTDDQRWDTLARMPLTLDRLGSAGVTFENAFATNPECCPFRASLHSGGFQSHNTGVLRNAQINGTRLRLDEENTLGTTLDKSGYRTGFVGRYMHGYESGVMLPGYDFIAANSYVDATDWFDLAEVTFAERQADGSYTSNISDVQQYATDFHREQALEFLGSTGDEPFVLTVGFYAPHHPRTAAPEDAALFLDYSLPDSPSLEETDVSDKPLWVRNQWAALRGSETLRRCREEVPADSLRTLMSVDRAVAAIVDEVERMGRLDDTVFFFTSDNGLTYGEHGISCDKGMAYEESIRVPFVVRWPGVDPGTRSVMAAPALDIGASIYASLGIPYTGDGLDLKPLLDDPQTAWRNTLYLENFGYLENRVPDFPMWAGVRVLDGPESWKYIEYITGEVEFYDLANDPYELESLHADAAHADRIDEFAGIVAETATVAIAMEKAPDGVVGEEYDFLPEPWAGTQPYEWDLGIGDLPNGLSLDTATGRISGVPTRPETAVFWLRVRGQYVRSHQQRNEDFRREFEIRITN